MLSNVAVDLLMDAFAGVLVVIMIDVLSDIGVDVLVNANVNVFAGVMAVGFAMAATLEGCSC